ncbi:MAG: hypothetical protein PVH88_02765 [Ignavibacteria bacterium]
MYKFYLNLIIIITCITNAQPKSNLEIINSLIDSAAGEISNNYEHISSQFLLQINTPEEFDFLKNRITYSLTNSGLDIVVNNDTANPKIFFNLNNAATNYKQIIKDGILGDLLLERELIISGTYYLKNDYKVGNSKKFYFSKIDTVLLDDVEKIEISSLPFTKDEIPSEPFFAGIIEPAVALGTVVVTVILFFTVRSN